MYIFKEIDVKLSLISTIVRFIQIFDELNYIIFAYRIVCFFLKNLKYNDFIYSNV